MTMKIIGAGFGRTGTMSMQAALEELGFRKCYHMIEVMKNAGHARFWHKASQGQPVEWDQIFEGYQATVDWPGCTFYKELIAQYPDALDIPATEYRIVSNGTWGQKLTHFAALCRCAQMAGAIETIFEMSLSYANQRHQFGRAIKRFQAIQHALAIMAGEVAAAVMATKAAFSTPTPWENSFEVAAAKSRVSQATLPITRIAHQVHAAIGFTAEYPLQLYTKRLWAWRDEFGNEMEWNERLGRLIIDSEQSMWEMLTQ